MRAVSAHLLLLLASTCGWLCSDAAHIAGTQLGQNMRIYGGVPVKITEVPFMAQYPRDNKLSCGAVIIHEQFVLSAGHCVFDDRKQNINVGSDKFIGGKIYEIEKSFRHPKYESGRYGVRYDIAVIKLKKKLEFSDRVQPIEIADSSLVPEPGEMMEAIGFGKTEKQGPSSKLLKVQLPYVNREKCQKAFEKHSEWKVTERMICAGGEEGKSGCNGDSGGPLFYKGLLMGLVSWGRVNPCAQKSFPTVFTYVPSLRDFVNEVIKNDTKYHI